MVCSAPIVSEVVFTAGGSDYATNVTLLFFLQRSRCIVLSLLFFFFFQAEDGIRDKLVTGVQTCALPISGPVSLEGYPAAPLTAASRDAVRRLVLCGWRVTQDDRPALWSPVARRSVEIGRASCRERV